MSKHFLRSLGPAVARTSPIEAFRAGLGAFIGLGLTGLFELSPAVDFQLGLYLVAPFGATSVLLFAVPNSPLAQPWSAIVGNTIAALVAVTVCMWIDGPVMRIALSVGLAISATILFRAVHPPAGAVAMVAAMSSEAISRLGYWFAISPIALGTITLVVIAAAYARLTGRRYPFRQFDEPNRHHTRDAEPVERLGLSETELSRILERYRQSFNVGVEDLARLIGAAELQAAAHRTGPLTAADIMSRNLVTVQQDTPLAEVGALFSHHKFTSFPVVDADQRFEGMIFQLHLISPELETAEHLKRTVRSALKQLAGRRTGDLKRAGSVMKRDVPHAAPNTPVAALLPLMAQGDVDAVPVIENGRIVGVVTRTDLIAALARISIQES